MRNITEAGSVQKEPMSTEQEEKITSFKNFLAPLTQETREMIIESIALEYGGGIFEQLSMEDQDHILHALDIMSQRESQEGPLNIEQKIHYRLSILGFYAAGIERVSHNVNEGIGKGYYRKDSKAGVIYITFGQRPLRYYLEDDEWGNFIVSLGSDNLELEGVEVEVYAKSLFGENISKIVRLERDKDQVGGEITFTREERCDDRDFEDVWVKFRVEK